jgi:hypothetical protein
VRLRVRDGRLGVSDGRGALGAVRRDVSVCRPSDSRATAA